jgi:hypothetical protein
MDDPLTLDLAPVSPNRRATYTRTEGVPHRRPREVANMAKVAWHGITDAAARWCLYAVLTG